MNYKSNYLIFVLTISIEFFHDIYLFRNMNWLESLLGSKYIIKQLVPNLDVFIVSAFDDTN